jgi:signal transduction histidine kinase
MRRLRGLPVQGRADKTASPLPCASDLPLLETADLLSLLAHQILTPIALIDTAAQRIARRAGEMETGEIEMRAVRIRKATTRLSSLVHALLARAQLTSAHPALQVKLCSAEALLDRAEDFALCLQPDRTLEVLSDGKGLLMADAVLLEQVLMILVSNALKFSAPETTVAIESYVEGGTAIFRVEDRGCGIPPDHLPSLFDAARKPRVMGGTGLGIGLSLADRIVRLHGGTLDVESRVGVGSAFTVTLPHLG